MSKRYLGGYVRPGYSPLRVPNAPTIGTATGGDTQASVAFTAPSCVGGGPITSYMAVSNPGCVTASASSSPVSVTGLTNGTSYTFRVYANNRFGPSTPSSASNSVTPVLPTGQQAYTSAGTYSFVVPSGVTSVSVVTVGAGASGQQGSWGNGGGAGNLRYVNNIAVTPGETLAVQVGAGGVSSSGANYFWQARGQSSYLQRSSTLLVSAAGGGPGSGCSGTSVGTGGNGGFTGQAGAGAGGYAGDGGSLTGGAGGNGGNRSETCDGSYYTLYPGGSGGGVGILGQGTSGANGPYQTAAGGGGSGGSFGANGYLSGGPGPAGGAYGGGAGSGSVLYNRSTGVYEINSAGGTGGVGAVRIIWPGTTRSFPSTNTGNL